MFKFNFIPETEDKSEKEDRTDSEKVVSQYDECHEIIPADEEIKETATLRTAEELNSMVFDDDQKVFYISIDDIIDELATKSTEIDCAEKNHSDLVPGVYEGGAKIWECTEDLGNFLVKQKLTDNFRDATVLDLGCGTGILGILAMRNGAKVQFQDYNKAVLEHITIPNAIANLDSPSTLKEKCSFYSGDWSNYIEKTASNNGTFDFILTSETIYNIENYEKIIHVLETKLKRTGCCYLAAKSHYFGVGGSLRHFESVLLSKCKQFQSESVFVCAENISREILKISFKS